jgi:hypothetical protein
LTIAVLAQLWHNYDNPDLGGFMRPYWILLLLLGFCLLNAAVTATLTTPAPRLERGMFDNDLPMTTIPGKPAVSYIPVRLLMPQGEAPVSWNVEFGSASTLTGISLDYARKPLPTSVNTGDDTIRDEAAYASDKAYPGEDIRFLGVQRMNGYDIALFNVYPYQYNPLRQSLTWRANFTVTVETAPLRDAEEQNRMLVVSNHTRDALAKLVANPLAIDDYAKAPVAATRPDGPFTMIVITNQANVPTFNTYADWKNSRGVYTGVFAIEDVYAQYDGVDHADQLRNFIETCYIDYAGSTHPLEYVLLGGDDEIIPIRGVYCNVGGTVDTSLPCDMYYSNLDGNWNADGDNRYGEVSDNPDMLPEVAIGRLPGENPLEFQRAFNKIQYYADTSSYSNDQVCLMGELLNNNPWTWGGDYKDEVATHMPDSYRYTRLYENYGTYSAQAVIDAIQDGVGIINHMGHANYNFLMGMGNSNAIAFSNTEYGFAYSQGCYPAAFDESTSQVGEAIAENLVMQTGGLYSFVGNTRYGWYSPGSIWGPSEYYDVSFFEGLFEQNIRALGDANNYSKEQLVNEALGDECMRWCYYELILFGDPTIQVKDATGNFPFVTPLNYTFDDSVGDGDGMLNPGETVNIIAQVENLDGWADADEVTGSISFEDPDIQIVEGECDFGPMTAGQTVENATNPFRIVIPQACNYDDYTFSIHIVATHDGGVFQKIYQGSFQVSMNQWKWPWFSGQNMVSAPMPYDMDGDGASELLAVDVHGSLSILRADATLLTGYPVTRSYNLMRSAALADLDDNGQPEVIMASRTGHIAAIHLDGTQLFEVNTAVSQLLTPMAADVDGNGALDVISYGQDNKVYALDAGGVSLPGFPVVLSGISSADMGAADLDGDGAAEILIGVGTGDFYAIRGNGSIMSGYPVNLGAAVNTAPTILSSKRIVVATSDWVLHLLAPDGSEEARKQLFANVANSAIICDLDNDNAAEIIFTTTSGSVYALNGMNACMPGFPTQMNHSAANPPMAADIDNDGELEIIQYTNQSNLYAYRCDGALMGFSPVPVNLIGNTPGAITDMDNDGDLEFVAGISNGIVALDCKLPKGTKTPWVTYRGDPARTGYYGALNPDATGPGTAPAPVTMLIGNYPNPFNPTTDIRFSLATDSPVSLNIYNLRGERVRSLGDQKTLSAGEHVLTWSGTDDNGRPASSGVYIYELRAGKFTSVKKMIMLK